jgi:hypothetical protein
VEVTATQTAGALLFRAVASSRVLLTPLDLLLLVGLAAPRQGRQHTPRRAEPRTARAVDPGAAPLQRPPVGSTGSRPRICSSRDGSTSTSSLQAAAGRRGCCWGGSVGRQPACTSCCSCCRTMAAAA